MKDLDEALCMIDSELEKDNATLDLSFPLLDKLPSPTQLPQSPPQSPPQQVPQMTTTTTKEIVKEKRKTKEPAKTTTMIIAPVRKRRKNMTCVYADIEQDAFCVIIKKSSMMQLKNILQLLLDQARRLSVRKSWAKAVEDHEMFRVHSQKQEVCGQRVLMTQRYIADFCKNQCINK